MNSLSFAWTEDGQGYRLLADRGQGYRKTNWRISERAGFWLLFRADTRRPIKTLSATLDSAMTAASRYAAARFQPASQEEVA